MSIAKVEPLTSARALRGPFDYLVPERLAPIGVGDVLRVPLGNQRLLGVVVELAESSELEPERLAEPLEILTEGLSEELVELGLWTARAYCSTPSRGLALVLPPGSASAAGSRPPRMELRAAPTLAGATALAGGVRLGARQRAVLAELDAAEGELGAPELRRRAGADRSALRRLAERGLIELSERPVDRRPALSAVGRCDREVDPNPAQRLALGRVEAALDAAEPAELLLWGVTGSGKTEVYLRAAERVVERGEGAIVLVPEIALTPQTMSRFAERLGDRVAILHSGLSDGERADEWRRLRDGRARVCVGPRSAVFAPVFELGLVVVDEEHDPSYKQEADPRYDARAIARHRAERAGATLLAGTATPRPESWLELERLELGERADGSALPRVEVLDMRGGPGERGPLHERTRAELVRLREEGGRAMVLVNRRGYSLHLSCAVCGWAVSCADCDVSLVWHRAVNRLACHHCGHHRPPPTRCERCGSAAIARRGTGVEQIAELVEGLCDPVPVLRLDADSVRGGVGHARVLERFGTTPSAVLVGTQMLAKGHDFADVRLCAVIDADASLRFPDFRAEERTFALVTQLAGRCGRGLESGSVLVQTLAPDADAIAFAARHDAAGFLAAELERRRALAYPPFSALIRVELSAPDHAALAGAAARVAGALEPALPATATLLGPAPRLRRRGRHRRHLLVKAPPERRESAVDAVREAVESAVGEGGLRGVAISVDVDPQ